MGKGIVVVEHAPDLVLGFDVRQGDKDYVEGVCSNEILLTVYTYLAISDKGTTSVKQLSFHDRILHLILSHTIRPNSTNYSIVKNEDFWFLYCINS